MSERPEDAVRARFARRPYVADSPLDAAALAVGACLDVLGADVAFVATVAEGSSMLAVSRVTPYAKHPVHLSFPIDAPYPLAETIRTREALFIDDNEQLECEHPGLVRVKCDDHACATLPLFAGGDFVGALNVGFEDPRAFTDEDREALAALARGCAHVLAQR
jgi:GAF domain-containing protein